MNTFKTVALIISLALNLLTLAFIIILVATPWLDIPLAAYSHQKNCGKDYDTILQYTQKVPAQYQGEAKQLYASIVCQRDSSTGQPLPQPDFNQLQKLLETPPQ